MVSLQCLSKGLRVRNLAVEGGGLFRILDAHIDFDGGLGGDHVGPGAAANNAGIHRHTCAQVVEFRDGRDLAGEFEDGAVSLAGVEAGVSGDAFDRERVIADAFARGLDRAARSGCGLEHEHGCGFSGERFGDFARGTAADFFVRYQKDGDRARQAGVPGLQRLDGVEHQSDAGFHVEHAGAVQASVGDVAGHVGERAEWVDGVEVAEEQDGLHFFAAGEIDLQVVAESVGGMHSGASAEGFESFGEEPGHAVRGGFVVAGGFDLDEFADGADERVLLGLRNSGGGRAS